MSPKQPAELPAEELNALLEGPLRERLVRALARFLYEQEKERERLERQRKLDG